MLLLLQISKSLDELDDGGGAMSAATTPTQLRARAAATSRLRTLACGTAFGILLGLSIALLAVRWSTPQSVVGSSGGLGSSSSSQARVLIRGSLLPPQQEGGELIEPGSLLKDVAWASHDPLAGQITTDLWLRRDLRVYVLPTAQSRESGHLFRKLLPGLLEHPRYDNFQTIIILDTLSYRSYTCI